VPARQLEYELGLTYASAYLLTPKLRRSVVDPNRETLEKVVEVDQEKIPVRPHPPRSLQRLTPR